MGLSLALELGWRGISCTLIEQSDGSVPTPKMNEVNTRTMEFCRRWGIAEEVLNCPFPDDFPMDVVVATKLGGHELGRIERPSRREQRPGPLSPMGLQVCPQHWFDPILRRSASGYRDVTMLHRHRLESFEEIADGVEAQVTDLVSGERKLIRSQYLVGADGAASGVRRALGIGLVGPDVLSHSMHLFFRLPDLFGKLGIRKGTFYAVVDREGYWGNVRIVDPAAGLWRILFDVAPEVTVDDIDRDAWLKRAFARPLDVEWTGTSKWTRRGVVAERFSRGRVFLTGDAVHQVSPTGALGMNTGIADAVDLGWKLAATLSGWGGASLLDSYDADRRPAGARNVRMATQFYEGQAKFQQTLDAIEDETAEGQALRDRVGSEVTQHVSRVFRTMGLQIGYRYEGSPICEPDGAPEPPDSPSEYIATSRPGARAPHVALSGGRSTLDLFGRGFVLLDLRSGDSGDAGLPAMEAAAAAKNVPLSVVRLEDPAVRSIYQRNYVLVRPDGHVAWRDEHLPGNPGNLLDRVRGA